jgi:hypothetical protein
MREALTTAWVTVADFVPRLVAFLLILLIGWLVARLVAKAVDKVLERVGFDRAVERGGIARAMERSRYDASTIVSKLVFYALLLLVLQLAFGVFGPNPVSDLLTAVIAFLPRLVVAIVIVVVAAAIASAVKDLISGALGGLSYGRVLANIAAVLILGTGIIAALNQVGIATTVTTPILIAVLATIGGILVVGVGGGLIRPMQSRWEDYLQTASRETENVKREVERTRATREEARATREAREGGAAALGATSVATSGAGAGAAAGAGATAYGDDDAYREGYGDPYGEGYQSYEDLERRAGASGSPHQVDLTDDATQPFQQPDRRW